MYRINKSTQLIQITKSIVDFTSGIMNLGILGERAMCSVPDNYIWSTDSNDFDLSDTSIHITQSQEEAFLQFKSEKKSGISDSIADGVSEIIIKKGISVDLNSTIKHRSKFDSPDIVLSRKGLDDYSKSVNKDKNYVKIKDQRFLVPPMSGFKTNREVIDYLVNQLSSRYSRLLDSEGNKDDYNSTYSCKEARFFIDEKVPKVRENILRDNVDLNIGEASHKVFSKALSSDYISKEMINHRVNYSYMYEVCLYPLNLLKHSEELINIYRPVLEKFSKTRYAHLLKLTGRLSDALNISTAITECPNVSSCGSVGSFFIFTSIRKGGQTSKEKKSLIEKLKLELNHVFYSQDRSLSLKCIHVVLNEEFKEFSQFYKGKLKLISNDGTRSIYESKTMQINSRMIYKYRWAEYRTLSLLINTCDKFTKSHDRYIKTTVELSSAILLNNQTVIFSILSIFRYIISGAMCSRNGISALIKDKFPKFIKSNEEAYLINGILAWLYKICKLKSRNHQFLHQLKNVIFDKDIVIPRDVRFDCPMPYYNDKCRTYGDILTIQYLNSLLDGQTKSLRHTQLDVIKGLIEIEDRPNSFFQYDKTIVHLVVDSFFEYIKSNYDSVKLFRNSENKTFQTLATIKSTFEPLTTVVKVWDAVLEIMNNNSSIVKFKDFDRCGDDAFHCRLGLRNDHTGEREIYIFPVKDKLNFKRIEDISAQICSILPSEFTSKSGEIKNLLISKDNDIHAILKDQYIKDCVNVSNSLDSSKWSSGDNLDIIIYISNKILESSGYNKDSVKSIMSSVESLKCRKLEIDADHKYIKEMTGIELKDYKFTRGWPQGTFNFVSSIKHYLAYVYAISIFKEHLKKITKDSGATSRMKYFLSFLVHSDDSKNDMTYDKNSVQNLFLEKNYNIDMSDLWMCCLMESYDAFCIKLNNKKFFGKGPVKEFLSVFTIGNSIAIPVFKNSVRIFSDFAAKGYGYDQCQILEAIRDVLRRNGGLSNGMFMINYSKKFLRQIYSLEEGMHNYNSKYNNEKTILGLGGYFSAHPLFLLLGGATVHDMFLYYENIGESRSLLNKLNYWNTYLRNPNSEIEEEEELDFMCKTGSIIPVWNFRIKSQVERIIEEKGYKRSEIKYDYENFMLNELKRDTAVQYLKDSLFSVSISRGYTSMNQGSIQNVILREKKGECMMWNNERINYIEFISRIEKLDKELQISDIQIYKNSKFLKGIMSYSDIDIRNFETSISTVSSCSINRVSLSEDVNYSIRYFKYSLCKYLSIEISEFPEYESSHDKSNFNLIESIIEKNNIDLNTCISPFMTIMKLVDRFTEKYTYIYSNLKITGTGEDTDKLFKALLMNSSSNTVIKFDSERVFGKMINVKGKTDSLDSFSFDRSVFKGKSYWFLRIFILIKINFGKYFLNDEALINLITMEGNMRIEDIVENPSLSCSNKLEALDYLCILKILNKKKINGYNVLIQYSKCGNYIKVVEKDLFIVYDVTNGKIYLNRDINMKSQREVKSLAYMFSLLNKVDNIFVDVIPLSYYNIINIIGEKRNRYIVKGNRFFITDDYDEFDKEISNLEVNKAIASDLAWKDYDEIKEESTNTDILNYSLEKIDRGYVLKDKGKVIHYCCSYINQTIIPDVQIGTEEVYLMGGKYDLNKIFRTGFYRDTDFIIGKYIIGDPRGATLLALLMENEFMELYEEMKNNDSTNFDLKNLFETMIKKDKTKSEKEIRRNFKRIGFNLMNDISDENKSDYKYSIPLILNLIHQVEISLYLENYFGNSIGNTREGEMIFYLIQRNSIYYRDIIFSKKRKKKSSKEYNNIYIRYICLMLCTEGYFPKSIESDMSIDRIEFILDLINGRNCLYNGSKKLWSEFRVDLLNLDMMEVNIEVSDINNLIDDSNYEPILDDGDDILDMKIIE